MIYSIIEFCLNSFNGPFHSMPACISGSSQRWLGILPYASLYVAVAGIRTPVLSFVILQSMLLFRFIALADASIAQTISYRLDNIFLGTFFYRPLLSIMVTILLHTFYQFTLRRSVSMAGRMTHATCNYITRLHFRDPYEILVCNFIINKISILLCIYLCNRHMQSFTTAVFSFFGVYFFLKTCACSSILQPCVLFNVNFELAALVVRGCRMDLLLSYATFTVLFCVAFISQTTFSSTRPKALQQPL